MSDPVDTNPAEPSNNGSLSRRRGSSHVRVVPQAAHTDEVNGLAVSSDSRLLASAGNEGHVKLWDLDSGRQLWSRFLHPSAAMRVAFNDGTVVSGGREGTVAVTRVADASLERRVSIGANVGRLGVTDEDNVSGLVVTREGHILACVGRQKIVALSREGATLGEWQAPGSKHLPLSPDGDRLVSVGESDWSAWRWSGMSLEPIVVVNAIGYARFAAFESNDIVVLGGLGAWRWRIGGAITVIPAILRNMGGFLGCSPDGRLLLAGTSFSPSLSIFDSTSGDLVATKSFEGVAIRTMDGVHGSVTAVAMAPSGALITAHGYSGTIAISSVDSVGVCNFGPPIDEPRSASIALDGSLLVVGLGSGVSVFDITTLTQIYRDPSPHVAGISPSGEWLVHSQDRDVVVERLRGARETRRFTASEPVRGVMICDDGQTVWLSDENGIEIRDAKDGRMLRGRIFATADAGRSTLIADGSFAWIGQDTLFIERIGKATIKCKAPHICGISFDGRSAVAAVSPWTVGGPMAPPFEIAIYDVAAGVRRHTVLVSTLQRHVALSPDGSELAVAGHTDLRIYNVATGDVVAELAGDDGRILSLAWSPDGRFVIATTDDGRTRLHVRTTLDVLTLITSGNEWLVYDIDGVFDASRAGADLVAAVKGFSAFQIEQLAVRNNRPDLLLGRLGLPEIADIESHYRSRYKARLQKLGLTDSTLSSQFERAPRASLAVRRTATATAEVTIDAQASEAELLALVVSVNGVPLGAATGERIHGTAVQRTISIQLTSGANRIDVIVRDTAGAESLRASRTIDASDIAKKEGALWFLGFGVSRYANPSLNLDSAHADAIALARYFTAARMHYREVHVRTWTDAEATRQAICRANGFLDGARVEDTLVVFVAGHGIHADDNDATYYFLPHDAVVEDLATTAVPFDTLEALLDDVAPRRKLMLLDTCASGDRDPTEEALRFHAPGGLRARAVRSRDLLPPCETAPAKPRSYLLRRENLIDISLARRTGAIVFSSSTGTELSYEANGHGLFTRSLLDVLTGPSGQTTLPLLYIASIVSANVATASNGQQHPVIDRGNPLVEIELPTVNEASLALTEHPYPERK